jgi:hypothetical protein
MRLSLENIHSVFYSWPPQIGRFQFVYKKFCFACGLVLIELNCEIYIKSSFNTTGINIIQSHFDSKEYIALYSRP